MTIATNLVEPAGQHLKKGAMFIVIISQNRILEMKRMKHCQWHLILWILHWTSSLDLLRFCILNN